MSWKNNISLWLLFDRQAKIRVHTNKKSKGIQKYYKQQIHLAVFAILHPDPHAAHQDSGMLRFLTPIWWNHWQMFQNIFKT